MSEPHELTSAIEAAEKAAATGDYASAEQHLREAVRLQEAQLGPLHPDLANTLNNLGVVCDFAGKPDEAEQCYRRACSIATAALEPDHPFVVTSQNNLRDFCEARGKAVELPIELPTPSAAAQPEPPPQTSGSSDDPRDRQPHTEPRPFAFPKLSHPIVIGTVGAFGLVFVLFLAFRVWFQPNPGAATRVGSASPSALEPPTSTVEHAPAAPIAQPRESASDAAVRAGVSDNRVRTPSTNTAPIVVEAQLCRALSTARSHGAADDWKCDRASLPVGSGPLFFYTRLKSSVDTTVQHRWYRGNQLRKAVDLHVRGNSTRGYRTYSRQTVDARKGDEWKVELRTNDGILLHEERFSVR